ncbi:hypothetical protein ACWGH2_29520 [Streptomyces sp. NPDC054871]
MSDRLLPQHEASVVEQIKQALSDAGAFCGECGFEPGERGCQDCETCWKRYADGLLPILRAAVAAELAKQRDEIADDIHRAELPVFAETENPVLVAKTVRAIDVRLADCGPEAPYWVAKAGDLR